MKKKTSIALIVPTIRENQIIEFLHAWRDEIVGHDVSVYIVEDNGARSFNLGAFQNKMRLNHLCHQDAPDDILETISLKSPGCRQIGFWKAYQGDYDILLTLDDDVRPLPEGTFFQTYSNILMHGLPSWVDPMQNYRSRGYPINNTGLIASHFHIGGFMGVPDVDGETQLKHEADFQVSPPEYINKPHFVANRQYVPVNGGICGWRREMTPYIHYTVWSKELEYRRFDDIWMGVILKTWFDLSGYRMSYGPPFVNHVRASDPHQNVVYEKKGRIWNEDFWQIFQDKVQDHLGRCKKITPTPDDFFIVICEALADIDNVWAKQESRSLLRWQTLLKGV